MSSDPGATRPSERAEADLQTSDDDFLGGRLRLRQPLHGYRAGSDAILLAAACPAREGDRVLDAGCGIGAAGLSLLTRVPGTSLVGLDLQADLIGLAQQNSRRNGLEARVAFHAGDILAPPGPVAQTQFDRVICNPPFYESGEATRSPRASRDLGHVQGAADFAAWTDFCLRRLRPDGVLSLIVRTQSLATLLALLSARAGSIDLIPLWPAAGRPAKRTIVRAIKGGRAGVALHPGLVLHDADGRPTPEADVVLRGGASLMPG